MSCKQQCSLVIGSLVIAIGSCFCSNEIIARCQIHCWLIIEISLYVCM